MTPAKFRRLNIISLLSTDRKTQAGFALDSDLFGIDNLQQVLALRSEQQEAKIPVVAIGGINLAQAPQVLATGVDSIAVVTAITEAENPEQAVAKLV